MDLNMRLKKGRQAVLLTMAVLGCLSAPAYAAADETVQTRDVMVTATRTAQEIKEAPASAEVITREEIEKMGADSLAQVLKIAVGLDTLENGMVGHTVSIRGMNTNQTLIMVNGRRIRTEDTSSTANAYELDRFNIETVERIEIVRGPSSSLYGSEALGGVVNIITKKPSETSTSITLSGTKRENAASVRADFGQQGKWSWALNARAADVKKRTDGEGTDWATNQYGKRNYFGIDGTMEIDENKKLDVYFDILEENLDSKGYKASMAYSGGRPAVVYNPKEENYDNKRYSYGVTYRGQDSRGDYELRAYYTDFTKRLIQRNTDANTLMSFDDMKFESLVFDGKRTLQAGENHLLTTGAEYRNEIYEGTRIGTGDAAQVVTKEEISKNSSKSTMDFGAFYLQDEWVMDDRWLVIPSVRYDHNSQFGGQWTAKIGSTYKLSDHSRIKANVGSAYRAPTASELYMNWRHSPSVITVDITGNPDLKPEKSMNYELSLEGERGSLFGKATYFRNEVDQLINQKMLSHTGMTYYYTYDNIDKATIDGLELEVGKKLSGQWTAKVAYTNLHAVDGNDNRIEGRAKNRVTAQLLYDDTVNSGVSGILWNEWVGNYLVSDEEEYTYHTLNVNVRKKISDTMSAYIGMDNILNKKIDALNLDGRIWRAGVTVSI